jgi:hypothetical protein
MTNLGEIIKSAIASAIQPLQLKLLSWGAGQYNVRQ